MAIDAIDVVGGRRQSWPLMLLVMLVVGDSHGH